MQDLLVEPSRRRVRAFVGNHAVADSSRTLLVLGAGRPFYAFPVVDVTTDRLRPNGRSTMLPGLGGVDLHDIEGQEVRVVDAAWTLSHPALAGHVAFDWSRIDRWMEEDEPITDHPRNIFKRVDAVPSSRRVQIRLDGETIADSTRAVFLFETGIKTRYYLPQADIMPGLLHASPLTTSCPYKGIAHYHHVMLHGKTYENLVWHYPDPVPECCNIAGMLAFYNEKVDEIRVDGSVVDRFADPVSSAAIAALLYVKPGAAT